MFEGRDQTPLHLGLSDHTEVSLVHDPVVDAFVRLGERLRMYKALTSQRQLIVALSVPARDYVAALIGAGWSLSYTPRNLGSPSSAFEQAGPNTYLRAVTDQRVVVGAFGAYDPSTSPPRVRVGGVLRTVDWYKAVSELPEPCGNAQEPLPAMGYLGQLAGTVQDWHDRVAAPANDLTLVGTSSWLREDMEVRVGDARDEADLGVPLKNYLLPYGQAATTWSTRVVPSTRLGEGLKLPLSCKAVVLDRYAAIRYLQEIEVPVVVCIVDRSVQDEGAADLIVQARAANSRPVSLRRDLDWEEPAGVEALAFTVAL